VLATTLALTSSIVWGVSDFLGGLLVRRHPLLPFLVVSQGAGVLTLAAATMATGTPLDGEALGFGAIAGVLGAFSVLFFFQAAALGTLSVASPLLASGSVVAFVLAVVGGESVGVLAIAGAAVTFGGVFLTSVGEPARGDEYRAGLVFALAAPVALGLFLYLLGRASDLGGSLAAVLGARASSFLLLVLAAAALRSHVRRVGGKGLAAMLGQGIGSATALLLFGTAASIGLISIAAILSSLYPVVTVLLAYLLLGERLRGPQFAGVPLVLAGVALVTAR
jgi:drug/metabolite transporter (DMT)-like permease